MIQVKVKYRTAGIWILDFGCSLIVGANFGGRRAKSRFFIVLGYTFIVKLRFAVEWANLALEPVWRVSADIPRTAGWGTEERANKVNWLFCLGTWESLVPRNYLRRRSQTRAKLPTSKEMLHRRKPNTRRSKSDHMVPLLEDRNRCVNLVSFSDDDSPDKSKENVPLPPPQTRNHDPCIDLTSDSPPEWPYRFNQPKSVKPKDDPDCKVNVSGRKKHNLRRYGATKGAIYVSDSSDEDVKNREQKANSSETSLMSAIGNDSKHHAKLVQPKRFKKSGVTYITDSDEEDPVNSNLLSKSSVVTTLQSKESKSTNLELNSFTRLGISRNLLDKVSTLSEPSTYLGTEPPRSKAVERSICSTYVHNANIGMPIPQSLNSTDEQSCNPIPSGSKESVPGMSSSSVVCPSSIVCPNVEPIDIDDDYDPLSSIYGDTQSRMTYSDLLDSYAAYESDDDRVSIVMGSPGSPSRDEDLLVTTEVDKVVPVIPQVEMDEVMQVTQVEMDGFVNVALLEPPTSNARRVLRTRTTPRITQSMMPMKRTVKKEPVCSTEPLIPLSRPNAAVQDQAGPSVVKPRGRTKKNPLQQPSTPVPSVKKAKGAVATECVRTDSDDKATPESVKLKREILEMQSQLKKVSALAARAAQHEREAMAAKKKEMLALQKAREANEKLMKERMLREREIVDNFFQAKAKKIKEKEEIEKAAREKEARDKEQAKREAQEKAWECPVCFEPKSASTQLSVTPCGHVFCKPCILQVGRTQGLCPLCNRAFNISQVTPLFFNFPV